MGDAGKKLMNIFQDTLRRIAERVEGAQAVSLLGVDGIPIDSYGPADGRAFESIAAELGSFVKTSSTRGAIEAGTIQQIVLETDRSTAILSRVTAEYYLLLLLSRDGNSGRGRFELRKAGLALEKELL
ncbi:MAG: roadblock/LC7 domain-containing protein [Acidobacteria bacterium]|nr:roadblock/LC7 domain-containing protein [Acidobacteriota bacterium]